MQPKWSRVSPIWSYRWRRLHPRTPSPRSPFPRPTSRLPAERSPGRKPPNPLSLPNLPNPPNPQRYPKPRNPPRCQKSRTEGRKRRRKRKSRHRLQNRPALQLSSLTQKKSWAKWTSPKRRRWSGSIEVVQSCWLTGCCRKRLSLLQSGRHWLTIYLCNSWSDRTELISCSLS